MLPPPPISTLFPYTTLFRSVLGARRVCEGRAALPAVTGHLGEGPRPRPSRCGEEPQQPRGAVSRARRVCEGRDRKSTRPELQSRVDLVCRLLLEKKKQKQHS